MNLRKLAWPLIAIFLLTACTLRLEQADQPPDITTNLNMAAELSANRQYSKALDYLNEAATIAEADAQPHLEMGRIYQQQQRWVLAADAFGHALRLAPDSDAATIGMAAALAQLDQHAEAISYWQRVLAGDDRRPEGWVGLGQAYLAQQQYEDARTAFTEANDLGSHPEAKWPLAALALSTDLDASRALLQQMPDTSETRNHLLVTLGPFTSQSPTGEVLKISGIAMVQLGEWPLAHYLLEQAADHQPEDPQVWAFLGYTTAILGLPSDMAFDQAKVLAPNLALTPYFEGIALRRQGNYDAAIDQFLHALDLDPNNLGVALETAQTLAEKGDYLSAEAWYRGLKESEPETILYQELLTAFYVERGIRITEVGLPEAEQLLLMAPNSARAHDLLGWAQFQAGDLAGAEITLRRAIVLEPDNVVARYHLGRVLTAQNRHDEAEAEFTRVIDWDTSGIYRNRILETP